MTALVLLLATQPQIAPPPKEVGPQIHNLTWTYTLPKLEIDAKDGTVEVRWTTDRKLYTVRGSKIGIRDGVVSVVGNEKEPARLKSSGMEMTGVRIDISIADQTFTVMGTGVQR